jgi:AraC family transcriptional regulator
MVDLTNDESRITGPSRESVILPGIEVRRKGRTEPFLDACPALSSTAIGWTGLAIEDYSTPACVIHRHEHLENFVHVVLRGSTRYEVVTGGKTLEFVSRPGTTFVLPRGTVDEVRWKGPTHRLAVAFHPTLLLNALTERTLAHCDIELTEHWDLIDPNISSVLLAMTTDLEQGSPAGRLYGEALVNAFAVYMLSRYVTNPYVPASYQRGLSRHRLRRVLDYIRANVANDLGLSELAAVAGLSPHYFAQLFKQSVGTSPHQYVLSQRIERAKESLCNPNRTVIEAGLNAGFQNPSHFARVFRMLAGVSPSTYRSEVLGRPRGGHWQDSDEHLHPDSRLG